jgi:hypothetical protein
MYDVTISFQSFLLTLNQIQHQIKLNTLLKNGK